MRSLLEALGAHIRAAESQVRIGVAGIILDSSREVCDRFIEFIVATRKLAEHELGSRVGRVHFQLGLKFPFAFSI